MPVWFFNSLPDGEYSNLLIVAAFLIVLFLCKSSSLLKNSYLPTFADNKVEILAFVYLNCIELCFTLLCYQLSIFSLKVILQ